MKYKPIHNRNHESEESGLKNLSELETHVPCLTMKKFFSSISEKFLKNLSVKPFKVNSYCCFTFKASKKVQNTVFASPTVEFVEFRILLISNRKTTDKLIQQTKTSLRKLGKITKLVGYFLN